MDARDLKLVVTAALIGLGGLVAVPSAHAQIDTQLMQEFRNKAASLLSGYQPRASNTQGLAAAHAVVSSRKVWVSAFNVPGQVPQASAGFELAPLTVGGQFPGAKVTARFVVTERVGNKTRLFVAIYKNGSQVATKELPYVTQPGTFTLTTDPITLQAGAEYKAHAFVNVLVAGGESGVCGAVATIPEIKWEI